MIASVQILEQVDKPDFIVQNTHLKIPKDKPKPGRKYLQIMCLRKELYQEYILKIIEFYKKIVSNLKIGKCLKGLFSKAV
jgi:hypothetical protein